MIILTTDHTHFPDAEYYKLMENDKLNQRFFPYFFDRIPFITYYKNLSANIYDAKNRTALDFTPTVLHLLNFKNYKNIFMGTSLFDNIPDNFFILSHGLFDSMKCLKDGVIYDTDKCKNFVEYNEKVEEIMKNQLAIQYDIPRN